jgi:hypothetical protein
MAMQGPIPVEFGKVFPGGAYAAGPVEKVRDFERSRKDEVIQQLDKETSLPLWVVEVIDAQEDARQRTVKVKIAAQVQPVLPAPVPGSPFTPVEFDGMTVVPYVDSSRCQAKDTGRCGARVAYSLKATGIRAPARGMGRPAPEHKDAA